MTSLGPNCPGRGPFRGRRVAAVLLAIYTPAVMGQFPATALIFRMGYVTEGPVVSHSAVQLADLYAFQGTPVAEEENLDQLRKADIPAGGQLELDEPMAVDPLAHYVGQVTMEIGQRPGKSTTADLSRYIDRQKKMVRSATGELIWNWGRGAVALDVPCAQGACGFLGDVGTITLRDVKFRIANQYGAVLIVSLDGKPLGVSERLLVQVMTEDRNYGWKTEKVAGDGQTKKTITDLGSPPIVVKDISGTVSLKRADAGSLSVTALDFNGYKRQEIGDATQIRLLPDCLHYLVAR